MSRADWLNTYTPTYARRLIGTRTALRLEQ
jgi:hypothetical protein